MPTPDETPPSAIEARIRADLTAAQRARDQLRIDTLRMALGVFHNEEVARRDPAHKEHGRPLSEDDLIALLQRQINQRREAAALYHKGGRADLAAKEEQELAILEAYLPAKMSDDEVRELVAGLIAAHGTDFRAIMPLASRATKGRADGRRVQAIVRELIG